VIVPGKPPGQSKEGQLDRPVEQQPEMATFRFFQIREPEGEIFLPGNFVSHGYVLFKESKEAGEKSPENRKSPSLTRQACFG
jgi:hypothetical protein